MTKPQRKFFVFFQAVLVEDDYGVASLIHYKCRNEGVGVSGCMKTSECCELSEEGFDI